MHFAPQTKVILLDIEGTTTPIDFVYQVLFPYARKHLPSYLTEHWQDMQADIAQLQTEHARDEQQGLQPPALNSAQLESVVAYLHWLMDQDRKSTPLKSLQGKVWEIGYKRGELKSQMFADVPQAFVNWQQEGKRIAIFSSGSVLAQKLLFTYTESGDLSGFISGWFDTTVGAKREAESYRRIAQELQCEPYKVAFISDVTAELAAAQEAGMQTFLALRPGNPAQPTAETFVQIPQFT
jgi:enolase-phosphatase E1